MSLPTLSVTPGSGATINTLPNAPQTTVSSVAVALANDQVGAAATASRSGFIAGTASAAVAASVGVVGGWVPGDTIVLDATGNGVTTSAVLAVATTQLIGTPTIATAGAFTGTTGTYNVQGTTGAGTKFYVSCTLTNGSGITAVLGIVNGGAYTTNPTSLTAEPVSFGGLTGATLGGLAMGIGALNVTSGGAYAPTTATQVATITATAAPLSTSGAGSLTGVTIAPAFNGVATQVAAANASRRSIFLQNISASNLGYSFFSTTPVIGVPGTETLAPNGSYEKDGFTVASQALYAIGSAFAAYTGREI